MRKKCFSEAPCFYLAHMAEPLGHDRGRDVCLGPDAANRTMQKKEDSGGRTIWAAWDFPEGACRTLWLAALDDRVKMAVISGYMYGYRRMPSKS